MLKRVWDLSLLFALIWMSCFAAVAEPKQSIDIRLSDLKNFYESIHDIEWRLTFSNRTNQLIGFVSCPTPYSIYVTTPNGDFMTFPRPRKSARDLQMCLSSVSTRIKPHETIETSFSLREMDESDFSLPGRYQVIVCYGLPWVLDANEKYAGYVLTVCTNTVTFNLGRCSESDMQTYGRTVMFAPENGIAFGVSSERSKVNPGESISVHVWLDNETDKTYNYASECGWDFNDVFNVYDQSGELLYDEIQQKVLLGAVPRLCGRGIGVAPHSCAMVDSGMLDSVYSLKPGKYYLGKKPELRLGTENPQPDRSSDAGCYIPKRALAITVTDNEATGKH